MQIHSLKRLTQYRSLPARLLALSLILGWAGVPVEAAQRIFIPQNQNATDLHDSLTGPNKPEYVIQSNAGQTLRINLIPDEPATAYFYIFPPGQSTPIYNSATDGSEAVLSLLTNGDYTIQVYLSGNARTSGQPVPYALEVMLN